MKPAQKVRFSRRVVWMDRFRSNRLFRSLVCLLLVCCILINCSPIRAEASVTATTLYGLGLAAILLLGTCGVVFNPTSMAQVEAIGQSWSDHMYSSAQTDEETEIVDVTLGIVFEEMTNPPEDPRLSSGGWDAFFLGKALEWVERFMELDSSVTVPNTSPTSNIPYALSGATLPAGTPIPYGFFGDYIVIDTPVLYLSQYIYGYSGNNFWISSISYFLTPDVSSFNYEEYYANGTLIRASSSDSHLDLNGVSHCYFSISSYNSNNASMGETLIACMAGRVFISDPSMSVLDAYSVGSISPDPVGSEISPDLITGGIKSALDDGHNIQDIELPDLEYGNIITEGQTLEEALTQTQTQLINGTMTWEQYVDLLTNGNGINITINNGGGTSNDYPIEEGGVSSTPLTPDQLTPYVVDLRKFFPFCIPFDLYDFFSLLAAEPEAPVFHWEIQDLAGNVYPIDIDLSSWDTFALVFRKMQLLLFVIGLAMASRKFIKW